MGVREDLLAIPDDVLRSGRMLAARDMPAS